MISENHVFSYLLGNLGHIVTNRHVVLDAERVVVQFHDGILAPAEVVGVDRDTDLAVIKVDPEGLNLTPVTFGNLDNLRVGDRIIVIGNPFGNTNTLIFKNNSYILAFFQSHTI